MPPKDLTSDEINALLALVNEKKQDNEKLLEYESLPASRTKEVVRELLMFERITEKLLEML